LRLHLKAGRKLGRKGGFCRNLPAIEHKRRRKGKRNTSSVRARDRGVTGEKREVVPTQKKRETRGEGTRAGGSKQTNVGFTNQSHLKRKNRGKYQRTGYSDRGGKAMKDAWVRNGNTSNWNGFT